MATSFKVADDLFLTQQTVAEQATTEASKPTPVNHIVVIDCSGSMYNDLPKIREQIKRKVPKLLGPDDTLSIIWFSGCGEFGTLLEAEPVSTLTDLQAVNQAIDRWLRPVGLTGFKEPLQEAAKLVQRVGLKNKGAFSLFFLSDGCDNQWSRQEVLKATEETANGLASVTLVEYGYYADRPLLSKMAEKAGGSLIFAEDFDRYAPKFELSLGKAVSGAPRKEIDIEGDPVEGFAFALVGGDLLVFSVEGGKVTVPSDIGGLWYLSPSTVGTLSGDRIDEAHPALGVVYAAISLYAQRMKPNVVYPLLKAIGDVAFVEKFGSCFGKQRYSDFMDAAKTAAFDPSKRFEAGWDPTRVPADDAFTVLDFLRILSSDEDNRVLLDLPDFKYSRIGRAQVDATVQAIERLTERIAGETDEAKKKEMEEQLAAAKNIKPLKFKADEVPDGYPVSGLTLNETRPNVSILVRKEGSVDLSLRLGKKEFPKLPRTFPTYIHRNYTIIKDGLVNVEKLPVMMTASTVKALMDAGMPISAFQNLEGTQDKAVERIQKIEQTKETGEEPPVAFVADLRGLPIINRKMVKEVSAEALFRKDYEVTQARAAQKVYNSVKKAEFPRESKGYGLIYGEDQAAWLKEVGITDYNGFNPQTFQAEAKDFYMGKELITKLKGLSSLPSYAEARKRQASGKMTPSAALMVPALEDVDAFLASDVYKKASDPRQLFEAWLDGQLRASRKQVRKLLFEIAQIKTSVIVGQTWFTEFKSLDENQMEIPVNGSKIGCQVEMREIQIDI